MSNLNQAYLDNKQELETLIFQRDLVAKLLEDAPQNPHAERFHELLVGEFAEFANSDDSLPNEMEMTLELQAIEKELRSAAAGADIYERQVVGVAGAFSAGKSAFINWFFNDKTIRLPENIEPTTAIPTFILHERSCRVVGVSAQGAQLNLSDIDAHIHTKIEHRFIKNLGFRLKKIMPQMLLYAPLKRGVKHICFIDTPGYSVDAKYNRLTREDKTAAQEFLKDTQAVIWLVNASEGTLTDTDLNFIQNIAQSRRLDASNFYVVVNKADLKPRSQAEEVVEHIAEMLDEAGIERYGVCAFNSRGGGEMFWDESGDSLADFLQEFDKSEATSDIHAALVERLFKVYERYGEAIKTAKTRQDECLTALQRLENNINALDDDAVEAVEVELLGDVRDFVNASGGHDERLEKLRRVTEKMRDAIDGVFGKSSREMELPELWQEEEYEGNIFKIWMNTLSDGDEDIYQARYRKTIQLHRFLANETERKKFNELINNKDNSDNDERLFNAALLNLMIKFELIQYNTGIDFSFTQNDITSSWSESEKAGFRLFVMRYFDEYDKCEAAFQKIINGEIMEENYEIDKWNELSNKMKNNNKYTKDFYEYAYEIMQKYDLCDYVKNLDCIIFLRI